MRPLASSLAICSVFAFACSSGNNSSGHPIGDDSGTSATDDASGFNPDLGTTGDDAYSDVTVVPVPPGACAGKGGNVTGKTFAPNGVDPIPHVLVWLDDDSATFPGAPTGVTCTSCTAAPPGKAHVVSGDDGSFTVPADSLSPGKTFTLVMESGGFRKVTRSIAVSDSCSVTLTAAQTSFAGKTSGDDLVPRIVLAGGAGGSVNDNFDQVLAAIGVTGYDTVNPNKSGYPTSGDLIGLLSDAAKLNSYQVLIVPCGALGNFSTIPHLSGPMIANLQSWLAAGGRLYSSDLAYGVIAKSFPTGINFAAGPSTAPTTDPGSTGVGVGSLSASVDDPQLAAWLRTVGATTSSSITVTQLRDPWGAVDSLPAAELTPDKTGQVHGKVWVSGDVSWHNPAGASGHHPLTVQADYPTASGKYCGRVVFTSYHVQSGTGGTGLTPQERVLEYLFFELTNCVGGVKIR